MRNAVRSQINKKKTAESATESSKLINCGINITAPLTGYFPVLP
jgi:hypothetical protein